MHQKRGFTLIELLVVIAIIGILATLVLTQLSSARVKARNSRAKSNVTEAGKAVEVYRNDDLAANHFIAAGNAALSATATATLNSDDGADFQAIFGGELNIDTDGATSEYSLRIESTPSNTYTYTYVTESSAAQVLREMTDGSNECYSVHTTVDTSSDVQDQPFFVQDGVSGNGAATCAGSIP